jgi:hypothetical protein
MQPIRRTHIRDAPASGPGGRKARTRALARGLAPESLEIFCKIFCTILCTLFAASPALARPSAATAPRYFFQLRDVKAGPDVAADLRSYAGEALKADLAGRPEWASDVAADSPEALAAELGKRKLRGFNVTVRFEDIRQEVRPPKPGGRLKQLAINVRLTVFGTTIAEEKLAFSGAGESGLESEVSDKRVQAETTSLTKDAIKDAVKQAVDQAVLKLSVGASALRGGPRKETKKRK